MKKRVHFILCLFLLFPLAWVSPMSAQLHAKESKASNTADEPSWQEQVQELNEKITLLKRWQEGYKMTAEQAEFKADRLQFEEDQLIDAKRLWKVAENANQKAEDLQVIIDKLVNQRNIILKRHNQPIPKK